MDTIQKRYVNVILACALAVPVTALVATPAQGDEGHWSRERNGCIYTGGISSDHRYAWTAKTSGDCKGHPWLKVYSDYDEMWEGHRENVVSRSGTLCPDVNFCQVYHRTQANESYGQSH
ncbi:hypothetical protein ACIBQ1_38310 [Nonomuraea sp. NPDC050153]|uniref:hypothetical protein n=1 Tax=Nonomuraea sp. NPDC050153 TaxID=3364359 RepID=UPI0037BA9A4E